MSSKLLAWILFIMESTLPRHSPREMKQWGAPRETRWTASTAELPQAPFCHNVGIQVSQVLVLCPERACFLAADPMNE